MNFVDSLMLILAEFSSRDHVFHVSVLDNADWVGIGRDDRCASDGGSRYCETITSLTSCTIKPTNGKRCNLLKVIRKVKAVPKNYYRNKRYRLHSPLKRFSLT